MNSNFFEMCNSVFRQNSHLLELTEDMNDYNTAENYLSNFNVDITYKGVLDVIKFLNELNEKQTEEVAQRIVKGDIGILGLYQTKK